MTSKSVLVFLLIAAFVLQGTIAVKLHTHAQTRGKTRFIDMIKGLAGKVLGGGGGGEGAGEEGAGDEGPSVLDLPPAKNYPFKVHSMYDPLGAMKDFANEYARDNVKNAFKRESAVINMNQDPKDYTDLITRGRVSDTQIAAAGRPDYDKRDRERKIAAGEDPDEEDAIPVPIPGVEENDAPIDED